MEELRLAAVEQRIDADLELGRDSELIGELEGLLSEHSLRERLRAQHMFALYCAGRQADASDAYQRARGQLVSLLGIEPGPELSALHAAILDHDSSFARTRPPADARQLPPVSDRAAPHHVPDPPRLPQRADRVIGREPGRLCTRSPHPEPPLAAVGRERRA